MQIVRIGLDLAKNVFEVCGVDMREAVVLRKTLRRDAVPQFFAELPPCLIGMEACSSSHYWAKVLTDLGHQVRLIAPQFVTPYVKSNKNDRNDAEAICEAISRPSMRFVPPKSSEQLEIQAVHRIRQRLVSSRTRLVNQIRGLLAEHGVVIGRDISRLRRALSVYFAAPLANASILWVPLERTPTHSLLRAISRSIAPTGGRGKRFRSTDRSPRRRAGARLASLGGIPARSFSNRVPLDRYFQNRQAQRPTSFV